ncbi:cytochrome c biogenesis protein CcsA [Salmonella enterica subsp. enterica]|nr:cytochrome c biogenesis protein CcsA [Salmonella enterica subsp. enterica]
MDAGGVGVPDVGYRAWLAGLLRAGLGGWWLWDPVENASLCRGWRHRPAALAGGHGTARRFQGAWTLLLSICAFSLCLLGTFPGAPGVLVSVHACLRTRRAECLSAFLCWSPAAVAVARRARAQGASAGEQRVAVARVAAARQQRPADGRAMLVVLLGTLPSRRCTNKLGLGSISVGSRL